MCPVCDELAYPVFQMTMIVKDSSNSPEVVSDIDSFYKLNYFTHWALIDGKSQPTPPKMKDQIETDEKLDHTSELGHKFFYGQPPTNLFRDKKGLAVVQTYIDLMLQQGLICEALVEVREQNAVKLANIINGQLI